MLYNCIFKKSIYKNSILPSEFSLAELFWGLGEAISEWTTFWLGELALDDPHSIMSFNVV